MLHANGLLMLMSIIYQIRANFGMNNFAWEFGTEEALPRQAMLFISYYYMWPGSQRKYDNTENIH